MHDPYNESVDIGYDSINDPRGESTPLGKPLTDATLAVEEQLSGLRAELAALRAQFTALSDPARSLRAEIDAIRREVAKATPGLHANIDALRKEVGQVPPSLHANIDALRSAVASLRRDIANLRAAQDSQPGDAALTLETRRIAAALFDRIPELRERLREARQGPEYAATFEDREPLVTVRMATYNRGKDLFERTIPSVLAQTYSNFELVIVGDGCTDATAEAIARIGDQRISFLNLPHRGIYPTEPTQRWMVAGSPAMNAGAERAAGRWLAPIDDDDEFAADHLAVLVNAALKGHFEMVYGKELAYGPPAPTERPLLGVVGRYPPEKGHFGFQSAIYMSLLSFFEYETRSWLLNEPGDWNLCRRMLEAGVRIGWVDHVVTNIYPTGPRPDAAESRLGP